MNKEFIIARRIRFIGISISVLGIIFFLFALFLWLYYHYIPGFFNQSEGQLVTFKVIYWTFGLKYSFYFAGFVTTGIVLTIYSHKLASLFNR